MRALCGAIITAGALIGLGLTALAYGVRYQSFGEATLNPQTHQLYAAPTLATILIVLLLVVLIGLGVSFLGLAFHHERRRRESHRNRETDAILP
jgi:cell division protein FtsX